LTLSKYSFCFAVAFAKASTVELASFLVVAIDSFKWLMLSSLIIR
jgi:hypothetical protein